MRVFCLNQDPGIDPARPKGAAVHLRTMRRAFRELGADVVALDESDAEGMRQALARAWARSPADLVYERFALGASCGAEFASREGVPHVVELNAPLRLEARRWRAAGAASVDETRAETSVLASASLVVAVSSAVAQHAVELGATPERVRVFANGVDAERFRPRGADDRLRRVLVPEGRFAIGFHGRLRPWHGFERLARAADELVVRGVPVQLVAVGEGDFESHLDGGPARRWLTRVPWVDHHEVPRYVACFDVLALTPRPEEAFYFSPLKLAEAMACGVVPLVPDRGDLTDVVTDGESGLVVPEEPGALADAITRLQERPEEHRTLARGARRAAEALSWTRIAACVLEQASQGVRG